MNPLSRRGGHGGSGVACRCPLSIGRKSIACNGLGFNGARATEWAFPWIVSPGRFPPRAFFGCIAPPSPPSFPLDTLEMRPPPGWKSPGGVVLAAGVDHSQWRPVMNALYRSA